MIRRTLVWSKTYEDPCFFVAQLPTPAPTGIVVKVHHANRVLEPLVFLEIHFGIAVFGFGLRGKNLVQKGGGV